MANVTKRIEEIDEEDDDVITQYVTHAQACEALETVLAYLEQQPDIPFGTNVIVNALLNALLNQTAMKRVHSLKQSRVSDYFENLLIYFQYTSILCQYYCYSKMFNNFLLHEARSDLASEAR